MADIKQLKTPIEVLFDQYECEVCKKKVYINTEDKIRNILPCPFCNGESKIIRQFQIKIEGIGNY
jgi:Zn finger protein HypA/HybF involved in hydrogenase expression